LIDQTTIDIEMTERALELARAGAGQVSPNPLVGCVIVSAAGQVVGEGTYIKENIVHAEVIALEQAGEQATGGTAYVSLEPHDHFGKTPPCTEALINAGIRRVVCPIDDPNPLVSGRGFERLKNAGVEVVKGIGSTQASLVNEKFIHWHKAQRPFVHLKLAISLDGRISVDGSVSTALSGEAGRNRVQEIRHEHDAILVGAATVAIDDPNLTDRSLRKRRRPLVRIVLDNRLQTPLESKLVRTAKEIPTMIFTNSGDERLIGTLTEMGVDVVRSDMGGRDIGAVLGELRKREIQSVLVEGGSEVAGSFVDSGLVDKFTFIISPMIIGGRSAPVAIGGAGPANVQEALRLANVTHRLHGSDLEITGYPQE